MAKRSVLEVQFAELDNLSVDSWIDKMKSAIKKAENVSGYKVSEATLNISVSPSLSIKFIPRSGTSVPIK
jgi:hypothetical protein